jgi:hypothetical protein
MMFEGTGALAVYHRELSALWQTAMRPLLIKANRIDGNLH